MSYRHFVSSLIFFTTSISIVIVLSVIYIDTMSRLCSISPMATLAYPPTLIPSSSIKWIGCGGNSNWMGTERIGGVQQVFDVFLCQYFQKRDWLAGLGVQVLALKISR